MTTDASARAIKPELLRTYTEDFNKDRANLIAADAAVSARRRQRIIHQHHQHQTGAS